MVIKNFGEYETIDSYVEAKVKKFSSTERNFSTMFELMFSEKENIMYEISTGYQIRYVSYGEAYEQVLCYSNGLKEQLKDIPFDSVVGLYMDNGPDWIIAFWSILRCGYRPLLLNIRLSDSVIELALKNTDTKAIVSDGKIFKNYINIQYKQMVNAHIYSNTNNRFGSEILVMSSGTTAEPKVCAYSAEEFYYQVNDSFHIITKCKQIKKHYEGQLKLLTFLPFYHVFGLIAVYIWFAFFSRTFVQLNDFSSQTVLNTIRRHKVTHIFAVPMFWNEVYKSAIRTIKDRGEKTYARFVKGLNIAKRLQNVPLIGSAFIRLAFKEIRDNMFGDSICFLITGGSEIKTDVIEFFNLIGYHLANGYGMTEIGITSVELSSNRRILNEGFVGKPLSSLEYRINDDGSLSVKGNSTARYIIENGKKTERNGWYNTGDLAECVNGHYKILGRKDDVVIAGNGENLNPCIIESLLTDGVSYQLCLIGTKVNNETVPAILVYAGRHLTFDKHKKIRGLIEDKLREHNLSTYIRKIVFVEAPLIDADDIKINRSKLVRKYENGELIIVNPAPEGLEEHDDEIVIYIKDLFAAAFDKPSKDISADTDFFLDEGGTSLDYFALITKIQEDYNISFPSAQDKTLTSVHELSTYIKEQQYNVD